MHAVCEWWRGETWDKKKRKHVAGRCRYIHKVPINGSATTPSSKKEETFYFFKTVSSLTGFNVFIIVINEMEEAGGWFSLAKDWLATFTVYDF